jgi:hypothetical protein
MDFSAPLAPSNLGTMDIRLRDGNRARSSRENKRRHRQRQKEYTAELESKLRHLQSEGIKATLEVQAAARKVFDDNLRLKALLRSAGIDEPTINTGTPRGAISNPSPAEGQSTSTTVCLVRATQPHHHFYTESSRKRAPTSRAQKPRFPHVMRSRHMV